MTLLIQTDATGAGAGIVDAMQGAIDLGVIANGDTGLGVDPPVGNSQTVTYARTLNGPPPERLDDLVNTNFTPDYGLGAGAQAVTILIVPVGSNFMLNDGTLVTNIAGAALPPQNSGLPAAGSNTTNQCLVIYDTSNAAGDGYCVARDGTGGDIDLNFPTWAILYHELSHATRIVADNLLALAPGCDPSSPEENAAIVDENDVRDQVGGDQRDPGIHCGNNGPCGGCCIIASVVSGSPVSGIVQELRHLRDRLLRKTEIGFSFFRTFFRDYYSFSPQICTLMAAEPRLRPIVLSSFVEPLLMMLRLFEAMAQENYDDAAIGTHFLALTGSDDSRADMLAAVRQADGFWRGEATPYNGTARELAQLLKLARGSNHVEWGLIEPVRIFAELLVASVQVADPEAVGRLFRRETEKWGANMPIDPVWGALPADQLSDEMAALDSVLLQTDAARRCFRKRLEHAYGDLPAIRDILARSPAEGAVS